MHILHRLNTNRYGWPLVLFLAWLGLYITNVVLFPIGLGWDEIVNIATAHGIARDGDFSAREYTVMGIIQDGYPNHLGYYPLFATYLALFLKVIGTSLGTVHFANWIAFLITTLLVYVTMYTCTKRRMLSGATALAYLIFPGIWRDTISGLMEPVGALLTILTAYIVVRMFRRGAITGRSAVLLGTLLAILWLYKMILIGTILGVVIFIVALYRIIPGAHSGGKWVSLKRFLPTTIGVCVALIFIATTYVFYPLSTAYTSNPAQQANQSYAKFLGGALEKPLKMLTERSSYLLWKVALPQVIYPGLQTPYQISFSVFARYFIFLFTLGVLILPLLWKKLSAEGRGLSLMAVSAILSFNIIAHLALEIGPDLFFRYNLYYVPLYVCLMGILAGTVAETIRNQPEMRRILLMGGLTAVAVFYIPLTITMFAHQVALERRYNELGERNAMIVRAFTHKTRPAFVYFNKGSHTPITQYPMRQISQDATGAQIERINQVLPEPIAFLFLRERDWLFEEYKTDIAKRRPIIGGSYRFVGNANVPNDDEWRMVVYRYDPTEGVTR
ncbi:MAG: hypothetical protein G01um101472_252 [Parcubacteria group bacterium Gr01-1014_72]|nr:MAG: hypothetical protein G01um101472_252 [Parcubacteria group bacterium Gr01-1014_72]